MLTVPSDTETLVHRLAQKAGRSPEDVIRQAVEASARRVGLVAILDSSERQVMIDAALAIARRAASRPLLDDRAEDDILGYDDHGIPR
jgi:antitoxin VapB